MPKIEPRTKPKGKSVSQKNFTALKKLLESKGTDTKDLKASTDIELAEELKAMHEKKEKKIKVEVVKHA